MKIVVAMDSFKGSLSSLEAGETKKHLEARYSGFGKPPAKGLEILWQSGCN